MEDFFAARGNPHDLITRARLREEERQRADLLVTSHGGRPTPTGHYIPSQEHRRL